MQHFVPINSLIPLSSVTILSRLAVSPSVPRLVLRSVIALVIAATVPSFTQSPGPDAAAPAAAGSAAAAAGSAAAAAAAPAAAVGSPPRFGR